MNTKLLFQDVNDLATPMLAVFAVDASVNKDSDALPTLLTTSTALTEAASKALASGEFKAGLGETLLLHKPAGLKAERLLIVGLGKAKTLSADDIRKGAGVAVRTAKQRTIRDVAIASPDIHVFDGEMATSSLIARNLIEGAEIGERDWDTYKSDAKDKSVQSLALIVPAAAYHDDVRKAFDEGYTIAHAQNFTRELVNEPGNVLNPTELGRRAAAMCTEMGLRCEVYSTEKLHELKMGAFWAVAKGSAQPPALIVITYEPKEAPAKDAPVLGLVGKGITFDSGGISLKPSDGMEKMKYDMAGAAAMIGSMRAIAELKPRVKVIAVICSAENMPDGGASKPGDVVTAMSGKTIEIVNTDAEGRLVLADGLHYAKTLGCTLLINAATLTGACMVALGMVNAGVFSNDEDTYQKFTEATKISGEKFWRLPCTDDYKDQIKSQIADMMNTGATRYGGATNAAMFLKEFAGETPWLHLDIAGLAWNEEQKPWLPKGPSGIAVRSIIEWVQRYSA